MKVTTVTWTCDRCHETAETNSRIGNNHKAPKGWLGLRLNDEAPDSAPEHAGWQRFHYCDLCKLIILDTLRGTK